MNWRRQQNASGVNVGTRRGQGGDGEGDADADARRSKGLTIATPFVGGMERGQWGTRTDTD